ncbi:MAG: GNAT family N-acetyltransferase [Clostridia bacterium]
MRTWKETHVEACTPGEYPELLRLLDASYGMENGWFLRHEGHLYPDPDENDFERISRNKLLKENGKILGGLGLFPLTFQAVVGGHVIHLSVAGIGSVFTVKEYRNQGVMSHMLDFAVQHVKENGYDLSWLSGNRHRYRNYGWDLAGRQGRYLVEEKAVRKYYPQDIQADISMPDETCKELLAGKYAGHQCGAVRDARHWRLQLKRDNLVWKTARSATGFACMVHDTEHPAEIPGFSETRLDGASINAAKVSGTLFPRELSAEEITLSLLHGTRMRYRG